MQVLDVTAQPRPDFGNGAEGNLGAEIVYFENVPIKLGAESDAKGYPVYKDVPHVVVISPGIPPTTVRVVAQERHVRRFPKEWEQFQRNYTVGAQIEGTPLSQWPPIDKNQIESLKYAGIYTVEQLAALNLEQARASGMGVDRLSEIAKKWLEQAKSGSAITQLSAQNEALQAQLAAMQQQLADIANKSSRRKKEDVEE
jgi:hypothetical protein